MDLNLLLLHDITSTRNTEPSEAAPSTPSRKLPPHPPLATSEAHDASKGRVRIDVQEAQKQHRYVVAVPQPDAGRPAHDLEGVALPQLVEAKASTLLGEGFLGLPVVEPGKHFEPNKGKYKKCPEVLPRFGLQGAPMVRLTHTACPAYLNPLDHGLVPQHVPCESQQHHAHSLALLGPRSADGHSS